MISTGFVQLLNVVCALLWNIQGEEITSTKMQWSLSVTYFFLHFFASHKLCTLGWRPAAWVAGNKTPPATPVGSCRVLSAVPVPMTSTWWSWWGQLQKQDSSWGFNSGTQTSVSGSLWSAWRPCSAHTAGEKKFLKLTAPFSQNYWF